MWYAKIIELLGYMKNYQKYMRMLYMVKIYFFPL